MNFTNTEDLKKYLFNDALERREMYIISDIEAMAKPVIDGYNVNDEEQAILKECLLSDNGYVINANEKLKELSLIENSSFSDKIYRCLERCKIVESKLKLKSLDILDFNSYPPSWGDRETITVDDKYGPIYKNSDCIIFKQQGRGNKPTYKYFITKRAFQKVLSRAYNDDKFADYFSVMMEIYIICDVYQSKFVAHKNELELKLKDKMLGEKDKMLGEKEDTIEAMRREMKQYHNEAMGAIHDAKDEASKAKDEASKAKEETIKVNNKLDDVMEDIGNMHQGYTETAYNSTATVEESKRSYFALTCIVENNGIQLRAWRVQKNDIYTKVAKAIINDGHTLLFAPLYAANGMNVSIAAMEKYRSFIEMKLSEYNSNKTKSDKLSYSKFLKLTGLKVSTIKPFWADNEFITLNDIINLYIDVITDNQSRSFNIETIPDEFKDTLKFRKEEYEDNIREATNESKEHLKMVMEAIENVNNHTNQD